VRVLVIGAGNTGIKLAARLSDLRHEVVIVDSGAERLARAEELVDAMVVEGWGASPRVLERAGIRESQLLVAVTGSDEVNILACAYAASVGVRHKIARVRNLDYVEEPAGKILRGLGVDHVVCDKEVTAQEISNLLRRPGAVEVAGLLGGRLLLVGIRVREGSPLAGRRLQELAGGGGMVERVRVVGLLRGETSVVPHGGTLVTTGDLVYLAVRREDADAALDWLHPQRRRCHRVVIVGAGEVGRQLALSLAGDMEVVVIEREREAAEACSGECRHVLTIHGDCLEEETLREAGLSPETGFAAVTGDDENNIIACVMARRMEAGMTVARISRPHYSSVVGSLEIVDRVVSDHLAVLNTIMGYVRGGQVRVSRSLDGLPGEILEVVVRSGSRWAGRKLASLNLPAGAIVAAVQRGEQIIVPTGRTQLDEGDVLVVFATPDAARKMHP